MSAPWDHEHTFGQEAPRTGEARTRLVALLTLGTMVVELIAGALYGSMALFADGVHMGSHATALAISVFGYSYARRHAADSRFTFGTGKVNSLAAFASAMLLLGFAALMGIESVKRLLAPQPIEFTQAIVVAILGLAVNGASMWILGDPSGGHSHTVTDPHGHVHHHHPHAHSHAHDHNLASAYLHVLADAFTSLLAIGALLAGKYAAWNWLDPAMGLVGAGVVIYWSVGLLRLSSRVLLDMQPPSALQESVRSALEATGARVVDQHIWSVGPGIYAAALTLVAPQPASPSAYREALPERLGLVHVTLEVHTET